MERCEDFKGVTHFYGSDGSKTLCGDETHRSETDLLGFTFAQLFAKTSAPVTCPRCATIYCKIKNSPWNEVDGGVLDKACIRAVEKIGE